MKQTTQHIKPTHLHSHLLFFQLSDQPKKTKESASNRTVTRQTYIQN